MMKEIYRYDVMKNLEDGRSVWLLMLGRDRLITENAATLPGRELARHLADNSIQWFAGEDEEDEG